MWKLLSILLAFSLLMGCGQTKKIFPEDFREWEVEVVSPSFYPIMIDQVYGVNEEDDWTVYLSGYGGHTWARTEFKKVKKCTVCHKTSHKSNYHSTTPAICENCGKLFRNRFTLTKHSLGCIDEKPCPICGKLVKQMKQHTDFRHTSDLDKKWRCEHCGKGFLVQRRMEIHTNSHLKLKPYKCRKGCDFGFSDPAHRGRHEKRLH